MKQKFSVVLRKKGFILIVLLILFLLGGLYIQQENSKVDKETKQPNGKYDFQINTRDLPQASDITGEGVMVHEEIHLGLSDGARPGNFIEANGVVIPGGGFVVVYRFDENNFFGEIIGSSKYLTSERQEEVPITTEERIEKGDKIIVVLHSDNGDRIFTSTEDDPKIIDPSSKIPLIRVVVSDAN